MPARLSLRAQIAIYLALTLVLAAMLFVPIALTLLDRTSRGDVREALTAAGPALVTAVLAACPGNERGCLEGAAAKLSSHRLTLHVSERSVVPKGAALAALPDGRALWAESHAPNAALRRASVASLIIGYVALVLLLAFIVGAFLLNRAVAAPVDQLAAAADRIGRLELEDPFEGSGPALGRLGVAFDRMAQSLKDERARVTTQIAELTRLNGELAATRDSLVRSEKLATVGRLAAGVAHEVGNPLGAIVGYLSLARSRTTSPEAKDYLDRIDREVARIDGTIRELLDFSRPGGEGEKSLAPLDLREAVDAAVSLARVQKRLRNVELKVDLPGRAVVLAEGHRLSQVLMNILLNAGDAMQGEGTVTVRAGPEADGRFALVVEDSGPGIREADLPRIFDPFFTTKDPGEGTGLGLSICHRIMEGFGGEIRAANREGGGAAFTLVFRTPAAPGTPAFAV